MIKKKVQPIAIGEIVKQVFTQIESEKTLSKEFIETCWKQSAGEAGFRHSQPTELKKGVLTVRVDSSAWMQELSMQKRQILKGLQRSLGKDRITGINFKIGEF
jgi:predicted nucleic acid-binding Zn ribbon protein